MLMRIENLCKTFNAEKVLDDVSFDFSPGIYVLTGPSGSGKTTFVRILSGLESPDAGFVVPKGYKVSFMFQEPRLFPWLDATDNVVKVSGCTVNRATELLCALELHEDLRKYPYELSVGMQRRVAIARALACGKADLYIFDEPFAGLDEERQRSVCRLIKENVYPDAVVIIISHELSAVSKISDRIIKLEDGKII